MSYIAPNSNIYLYNNIFLNNEYKDTLYFDTINAQNNYFEVTKPYKYLFTTQSYQRTNKGTLKIEKNAELIGDCNYMRFNNTREGESKWYYAFITNWEYINENVTEITYEIDDMQSYLFDVRIEDSFVVRTHSATDGYNENVITEDINIGSDYICMGDIPITGFRCDTVVIMSTKIGSPDTPLTPSSTPQPSASIVGYPQASTVNRVPTTVGIVKFQSTDQASAIQQATNWLIDRQWNGVPESVIGCYYVPNTIASCIPDGASYPLESGQTGNLDGSTYQGADVQLTSYPTYFKNPSEPLGNAYYPRNKKLYNYPYNYFTITNLQGQEIEYKYELFFGNIIFGLAGIFLPQPTFMLYPKNYRGVENDYDSALTISDFPTMPITVDGYQQWLNHNAGKMTADALNLALSAMTATASYGLTPVIGNIPTINPETGKLTDAVSVSAYKNALSGKDIYGFSGFGATAPSLGRAMLGEEQNEMGIGRDIASGIVSAIGSFSDASRKPNGANGNSGGGGVLFSLDKYEYHQHKMQIRRENAEMLDTYFDIFGYQQNKVMQINRNVRPVYTYIKTSNCGIVPSSIGNANRGANSRVISKLSAIYDKGITFWNPDSGFPVGDYSLSARQANAIQ